jgi:hypothetical protein
MRNLIATLILSTLFVSCNTSQKVQFNKDWSGSAETIADFKGMYDMLGEEQQMDLLTDSVNQIKLEQLKNTPGISKVKATSPEKSKIIISYDFANIDALNASGNLLYGKTEDAKFTYFELQNKNELIFNYPPQEEGADMGMGDQFIFEMEISSKRKIKEIETTCENLTKETNSVKISTNLTKLSDPNTCKSIKIKFK